MEGVTASLSEHIATIRVDGCLAGGDAIATHAAFISTLY